MADRSGTRSVMPHPPGGVPGYFDRSPYDDAQLAGGGDKSRRLGLYEELARTHFAQLPDALTDDELAWLEKFHSERLAAEREERRMHFGALALVSVLFFLLLPATLAGPGFLLALAALEVLLLVLLVPYVFVYFGYENRVRAMTVGLFRLIEARALRAERARGG